MSEADHESPEITILLLGDSEVGKSMILSYVISRALKQTQYLSVACSLVHSCTIANAFAKAAVSRSRQPTGITPSAQRSRAAFHLRHPLRT